MGLETTSYGRKKKKKFRGVSIPDLHGLLLISAGGQQLEAVSCRSSVDHVGGGFGQGVKEIAGTAASAFVHARFL